MTSRKIPVLTIGLVMLTTGLYLMVPDLTPLYFSADGIARGELWRFITGHLVHADLQHLIWNCLGLAVLGALIEQYSRARLWASLGVGMVAVSALLMSPFSQLVYYCGLSGVLNTLLLVVLWHEWSRTRSRLVVAIACGSIAKAAIEVTTGQSVLTHISWPPYAWSHVAGLAGGALLVGFLNVRAFQRSP